MTWDKIKAISSTKAYNYERDYSPYIANLNFSRYIDTLAIALYLNNLPNIAPKNHYDVLFHTVPKAYRSRPWPKAKVKFELLEIIQEIYCVSLRKSQEIAKLITSEQIKEIEKMYKKGG
jgi:hypothetical protein